MKFGDQPERANDFVELYIQVYSTPPGLRFVKMLSEASSVSDSLTVIPRGTDSKQKNLIS